MQQMQFVWNNLRIPLTSLASVCSPKFDPKIMFGPNMIVPALIRFRVTFLANKNWPNIWAEFLC